MDQDQIIERIERAHRRAAAQLKEYLIDKAQGEPDWKLSKQIYSSAFISEIYVNSDGVKDYDPESLSQLIPQVIRSFGTEDFNVHVQEVMLDYQRTLMNKKILLSSAMAILSSKFSQEEIAGCKVEAWRDNKVRITKSMRSKSMSLDILLSKSERVSSIKELLAK